MDAVVLALCSAALFGAMTVALRSGTRRGATTRSCGAFAHGRCRRSRVALVAAAIAGDWNVAAVWPFALAGIARPRALADPVHPRDSRRRPVADLGDGRDGAALRGHLRAVLLGEPLVAGHRARAPS